MDRLDDVISTLTYLVSNKKKRHIIGGILLSVSLLFGGLAATVMSIKNEEYDEHEQESV
nr:MAG TPA: Cytochrome oxidase maturation protein cbb3-type [Bacteriophage sp.]